MNEQAAPPAEGDNSEAFNGEKYLQYVETIEAEQAKIDAIMDAAKKKAQPHKEKINEFKKDAHNDGFRRRPLNLTLAERRNRRREKAKAAKLNDDQRSEYDRMVKALGAFGDTELGQAALQAAQ